MPFIDINLLKETINKYCPASKLSTDQQVRNTTGKVFCYRHDLTAKDTVSSPNPRIGLPDIVGSHSTVSVMDIQESIGVPFEAKLIKGTQLPYPGFPSLRVLPIAKVEKVPIGLNCFGTPSKYPNTVLTLHEMPALPPIEVLGESVLGKSLFVNWPLMHEARVVSISDGIKEIKMTKGKAKTVVLNKAASERWVKESEAMAHMYYIGHGVPGAGGVQINEIKYRLKVLPLQGMRTNPTDGSTKKLFGKQEADVPLQLALWQAPAPDPRFEERGPLSLAERFPVSSSVVLTKGKHRGCKGIIAGVADKSSLAVKVGVIPAEIPFGLALARSVQESYIAAHDAAKVLKLHPALFGKVTGKLQFEQNRYDLGLNLKSAEGDCVVGYTRKKVAQGQQESKAWTAGDSVRIFGSQQSQEEGEDARIQWEFSSAAIRLVDEYRRTFPQLFAGISKSPNERKYDAKKVFGSAGETALPVIREWLNKHASAKLPRSPVSSDSMSYAAVGAVQRAADVRSLALKKKGFPQETLIKVPGSALYREASTSATDVLLASDLNENMAPRLGDRIVNLCADGVPFGARGTVVTVHEAATTGSVEVVMDEEFVGGSSLQGACSNFRGKLCLWSHLLRIVPENSERMVSKLVPKGAGKAAVEKIISSIEHQLVPEKQSAEGNAGVTDVNATGPRDPPSASNKSASPLRTGTGSSSSSDPRARSRTGSNSRSGSAKQGRPGYRESRKPDEGGVGFKRSKNTTSGFQKWKRLVSEARRSSSVHRGSDGGPSNEDTSEKLKNMLGITTISKAPPGDESAMLKDMIGVHRSGPPVTPAPLSVKEPSSAAEKLLQIMASKQPQQFHQPHMQMMGSPPVSSPFSFTYVEEGSEQPPNLPPQNPPQNVGIYHCHAPQSMAVPFGYPPQPGAPLMIQPLPVTVVPPVAPSEEFPALGEVLPPKEETKDVRNVPPESGDPSRTFLMPSIIAANKK